MSHRTRRRTPTPRPTAPHPTDPDAPAAPDTSSPAAAPDDVAPDAGLDRLGWDDGWRSAARAAAASLDPGARPARVGRADRGACDVLLPHPVHAAWSARLSRAVARDPGEVPAAGDWVVVGGPDDAATVLAVLPRRTALTRAQVAAGSSWHQVLAANADVVAVVEGMAPDVDLSRVERLLTLAWASGARPVVVLTKADLAAHPGVLVDEVAQAAPGAEVIAVDTPGGAGLAPLRELLAGGATVALLGASGVGKSTLLNALCSAPAMRTRALRADGKGRHTTVTRELHLGTDGGAVIDTPGLRAIGLAGAAALGDTFADVAGLAAGCRFTDCAHETEPGCAVLAAVASGDLPERRPDHHRKLQREALHQQAWVDARLRAELAGRRRAAERAYRRGQVRP